MPYFTREIESSLKEALKQFPACLITGPRQSGKSTLLQHVLKGYTYITLDDPLQRTLAHNDPELFLSTASTPLIIDEIQYVPELLPYLKIRIDTQRQKTGLFVLTGSQTFQLMRGVSETLAGRIAIFNLYPFSWKEIEKMPSRKKGLLDERLMAKQLIQGFYPEFFIKPRLDKSLWYGSYLATYVERDVRNLKSITDLSRFQTFISLLATRCGQLLNLSEIGKECGITQPTAKSWLSILEATYIIYLLKPYYKNLSKRLVKTPKLYFVDTGLVSYLLGIDTEERFFKAAERGHLFENMVVMEIIKRLAYVKGRVQFYFYRTSSGIEIDLIIDHDSKLDAYEIKFAKTLSQDMSQPLLLFKKDHAVRNASLLSLYEPSVTLAQGVLGTHWSKFPS